MFVPAPDWKYEEGDVRLHCHPFDVENLQLVNAEAYIPYYSTIFIGKGMFIIHFFIV
jgi:hypothetical protein